MTDHRADGLRFVESEVASGVVLRPHRARLWIAVALAGWCAACAALAAIAFWSTTITLVAVISALPLLLLIGYPLAMTRALVVRPGVDIAYRGLLGVRRSVPIDATTELLAFTELVGSSRQAVRWRTMPSRSPIGVIDQRWAVLRSGDRTRIRLSTWFWSRDALARLAVVAPLSFRIRAQALEAGEVATAYADYYTWLERHPRFYLVVFLVALFAVSASILVTTSLGFIAVRTLFPAP